MNRRKALLIALVLALGAGVARADDAVESPPAFRRGGWWLWFVPGGGQFWLGQTGAGIRYAAGTVGLAGWGAWAETRRGHGEINAPLVWAQQLYVVSFYDARRDLLLRLGATDRLDPSKVSTLAQAPFSPRYLLDPWVIGFAAAGVGANLLTVKRHAAGRGYRAVTGISYLGGRFGRDGGTAALSAYWIPVSYGAGEAEEMLFRGTLQADWEERLGTTGGWLAASGVFGLCHLTHPRRADSWAQAGFATVAGLMLGWRYRACGYRLGEPIASHAWFDIAAGITAFCVDPQENPLGAKIRFGF
jgi:membrane protease YdiL (CAAX protease family)